MLELIADYEILAAGVGAIIFAVSYGVFFQWRRTQAGRALMYFVLSLVALFLLNALGRFSGGDYFARDWLRLAIYTSILVTVWRLVYVLWRNWRSGDAPLIEPKRTKE